MPFLHASFIRVFFISGRYRSPWLPVSGVTGSLGFSGTLVASASVAVLVAALPGSPVASSDCSAWASSGLGVSCGLRSAIVLCLLNSCSGLSIGSVSSVTRDLVLVIRFDRLACGTNVYAESYRCGLVGV